jgi:hypothetical protein
VPNVKPAEPRTSAPPIVCAVTTMRSVAVPTRSRVIALVES